MLARRPTRALARLQCTREFSIASLRSSAMVARISSLLPGGHRSRPSSTPRLMPSATTGSPTTTFAGAACRPSSFSPSTASCACTCARVPGGVGMPPLASVWTGWMSMPVTHSGGVTGSSSATPVKSVAPIVPGPRAVPRGAVPSSFGPPTPAPPGWLAAAARRSAPACGTPTPRPAWRFSRTGLGRTRPRTPCARPPPLPRAPRCPTTGNTAARGPPAVPGRICRQIPRRPPRPRPAGGAPPPPPLDGTCR
eukprot:266420-Pleurochrysis_carterae.AAC.1